MIADIWLLDPANWLTVLMVAFGLGMVIFVHELGHFMVAKWCGVKCEKFYLGFDIGGLKLFKFHWGETEYGIGVLPLGGYVKMLGQDDNPGRLAEEMERARSEAGAADGAQGSAGFDPRSYLAKSVPQRMAIISAGVIMNVIFAFVVASIAYGMGVSETPCLVGGVRPGSAAWRAGLQPGDRVVQIGNLKNPRFQDLQSSVVLGDDIDEGVRFVVERPGEPERLQFNIVPDREGLAPMIGMYSGHTNTLRDPPVIPGLPAARLSNGFQPGDEIVAVGDVQVSTLADLKAALATQPGAVDVSVIRQDQSGSTKRAQVRLPAVPMLTVGLEMEMGPITAVQQGSPAETAGLVKGDRIVLIDGQPPGDPLSLPYRLAERSGRTLTLTLDRDGDKVETTVALQDVVDFSEPDSLADPVAVPSLGVAFAVENRVARIVPGSPAAQAKIRPGDEIVAAAYMPPDDAAQERLLGQEKKRFEEETLEVEFKRARSWISRIAAWFGWESQSEDDSIRAWPAVFHGLQQRLPGTRLQLTLEGDRTVVLEPQPAAAWLNPDRYLRFNAPEVIRRAESVAEATSLGGRATGEWLSMVYRFLKKIITGQVSVKGMGGPVLIAKTAGASAEAGMSQFLTFLGLLSANLAVINFLPIPVLDGGHMVFLALEGIRGKPVSERVAVAWTYTGLLFIFTLMTFVILLDIGVIPRI